MSLSKQILSLMPEFMQNAYNVYRNKWQLLKWNRQGKPIPVPHAVKQNEIIEYKNRYNIDIFVESGTYMGDMIWAQRNNFKEIYSIELSKYLADKARKRFKKRTNIKIIQGDSGKIMPLLIREISDKALFWLDGHYSEGLTARGDKDCPIIEELKAILSSGVEHILMIDDARCFTGQRDYPTIEGLSSYILRSYPATKIHVENDCIIVELRKETQEDVHTM